MKKRSKILISCLMMVILAAVMMTGCSKKKEAKPEPVRNPLADLRSSILRHREFARWHWWWKTLRMPARSGE